jgi:glycosyltransferase involved in cell wall biosynthesis
MTIHPPIRVVMVIQAYLPIIGGAERQIASLSRYLRELNVELHVVTRRYAGLPSFEVIDNVPVHRIPIAGPKATAAIMFIFYSLLKIHSLKPDLLHAHELLSPATIAVFGKWFFKKPVLAKILRGGQLGDLAKVKAGMISNLRLDFLASNIDAFAVISREIDSELASIGVPEAKRIFLPNGVDTERFQPVPREEKTVLRKKLNLPDGKMVIYCGRLQPEKRVDQLISAWSQVQGQEKEARLVIVGTGPEESRLRTMANEKITFTGAVDDVPSYLNAADVYVLPSSAEGLSNSLLEAMACGLPVVATDVGGAPDLIEHGNRGLLIPPDAPGKLADALLLMLGDEKIRARCGAGARKYVMEHYSLPKMAQRMRDLYDGLLQGRTPFLKP